ncbi:hypothetical protein A1O7_07236 [Cladophialophora yegresii CBS 114405]|uniref:Uncharacterized protein n=1 Tax=Cladophialophora yegresii CBS 114405 TaxID=1182544 RepID=W9VMI9_9EURO|nr:uncharacterized protein A1O7_07236 [Cladophialophora yegresii CBS 114405]EXJ56892.1 hypothetical protein A1O7_07236 [Cladophialophora yegresii CBS 114405]
MRLINTHTGSLEDALAQTEPRYAVLSHCWTKDEILFPDIQSRNSERTSNHIKFWGSLQQAKSDGLKYIWIDTCCIDKQSTAELSEAINSMYRWYQGAEYCYVYLHDVDKDTWQETFPKSKWFTRGWTLQELLAPPKVMFYDRQWQLLGDKKSLASVISRTTGIESAALETRDLSRYSVAQKMSWAADRETTRAEDIAYCLMGLFGVNMPLLYGEGDRAFLRLQEEIIKYNDDHSIFAWSMGGKETSGLLAPAPTCFSKSGGFKSIMSIRGREPFSMTNRGLSIKLKITPWSADTYLAGLGCAERIHPSLSSTLGIFLRRLNEDDQYTRVSVSGRGLWRAADSIPRPHDRLMEERRLFVRQTLDRTWDGDCLKSRIYGFKIAPGWLPSSAEVIATQYSPSSRTAVLQPGDCGWGRVVTINFSAEHEHFRWIVLGFDFDFNPICFLGDSNSYEMKRARRPGSDWDWSSSSLDTYSWDAFHEGRIDRRSCPDEGWALKGCRRRGLNIQFYGAYGARGAVVTLTRREDRSQLVWELHVDKVVSTSRHLIVHPLYTGYEEPSGNYKDWQARYAMRPST